MNKIKLLTFYSDSHKEIYEDYFLKSYNEHMKDSFELKTLHVNQLSTSGNFESSGFKETMQGKLTHIIENIDIDSNDYVVYADCDIQFFSDFKDDLDSQIGNYDMMFQDDIMMMCAGFIVFKQTGKVLQFFQDVLGEITRNPNGPNDQLVMNSKLRTNLYNLKHKTLSQNNYFTVASVTNCRVWNGEDFKLNDKNIYMHHSNYTIGLPNKISLMKKVKEKLDNN